MDRGTTVGLDVPPVLYKCHILHECHILSFLTVMPAPAAHDPDPFLRSVVEHVFMPPKLPQEGPDEQMERKMNVALCNSLLDAAQDFLPNVPASESPLWNRMIKVVKLAHRAATAPLNDTELRRAFSVMAVGGTSI